MILSWWEKGNITSTINALGMMNDVTIVLDVVNATFVINQGLDKLNYENLTQLLPYIKSLLESKYESYVFSGVKSLLNIL